MKGRRNKSDRNSTGDGFFSKHPPTLTCSLSLACHPSPRWGRERLSIAPSPPIREERRILDFYLHLPLRGEVGELSCYRRKARRVGGRRNRANRNRRSLSSPVHGGGAERALASEAEGGRAICRPLRPADACAPSGHLPRKRGRKESADVSVSNNHSLHRH